MSRLIDPSLKKLSLTMGEMGSLSIKGMGLAMESFMAGTNTTRECLKVSDALTRQYHGVEDLTFEMLLKYQPVARDFRLIRSSIEISYAFLRFGRYAYDISLVRDSFGDISECKNSGLNATLVLVERMIREAVHSFATMDLERARHISAQEAITDAICRERMPALLRSDNVKCALAEALVLRYLERMADHALFMSDAISYIVTGKHRLRPPATRSRRA